MPPSTPSRNFSAVSSISRYSPIRIRATTDSSSNCLNSSVKAGDSPVNRGSLNPSRATWKSVMKSSSKIAATPALADAENTAITLTRATPIISDDAVAAVRRGLRIAFS